MLTTHSIIDRYNGILLKVASYFHLPTVSHKDVPAGVNGPHLESNTNNLRIISHLTIMSYYLYRTTGEKGYLDWVNASLTYIEQFKDPLTGVYRNTNQSGKDPNNALVGQAWVLQALLYVSGIMGADKIEKMIFDVIESHEFDKKNNVYTYPVKNGKNIIHLPDFTLNHQIWFSSIISRSHALGSKKVFREQQRCFFGALEKKIRYKENRINHLITQEIPLTLKLRWLSNNPWKLFIYIRRQLTGNYRTMATGYIPFSLWGIYGNDELYGALGDTKDLLDRVLTYFIRNTHIMKADNPFTWGYNMSGIELAISYLRRFKDLDNVVLDVLTKQIDPPREYVIADFTTYIARHYELVYLIEALQNLK
jgi:hypothetical protein